MENKTSSKTNIFLRHVKLTIILIYNIGNIITAAIVYPVVPLLMGYPKEIMQANNKIGVNINMQYVLIDAISAIFGTIILLFLLRGIQNWETASANEDHQKLKKIKGQCINIPYSIFIIQFGLLGFTTLFIGIIVCFTDRFELSLFIKLVAVVFSFCCLAAEFSHIFSKRLLTRILVKTSDGYESSGTRINLRNKIFILVFPMFIAAMLFISLFVYTNQVEEKGNLTYKLLKIQINNALKENRDFISIPIMFNALKKIEFDGTKVSYYAVNSFDEDITFSNDFVPDVFFKYFSRNPIDGARVYGLTNEIQGVQTKVKINGTDYFAGIKFENVSSRSILLILLSFLILIGLNVLILYYFTKSFLFSISMVSKSLTAISEDHSLERNKKLPVVSNDEIGDMVIAFNRIRDRELEYDKLKNEFIADISHELRTPISIIFSSVQLMELYNKKRSETNIKNSINRLNSIKQNSLRLLRLINNIIDLTKIDSGYSKLNLQRIEIVGYVHKIVSSIEEYAENRGIKLYFNSKIKCKAVVFDPDKIEAVILNLLSNAIKFTREGGSVSLKISEKEKKYIRISVKDSGIGIPNEMKEIIFERFRRVDQSNMRSFEGSGIGLSLAKSFIELHNGKISVISEEDKGSEFIVDLPLDIELEEIDDEMKENYIENTNNGISRVNIEFPDIYES